MTDVRQIAASAIEVGLAFITGDTNVKQKDGLRLLEALESDLAALNEAKTKIVDGKPRPAGDFLVIEDSDKPSTWRLPVKVNGKPDHNLMGAAKAALTSPGGHRGNKYEGPDKSGAVKRLKSLYKSEDMKWTTTASESALQECEIQAMPFAPTALTFADMAAADDANQAAENVRHLTRRFQMLFDNVMFSEEVDDKMGAVQGLVDELAALMGNEMTETTADGNYSLIGGGTSSTASGSYSIIPGVHLGELHADGVAVEVARDATEEDLSEVEAAIESGRRAPVVVDFQILQPGPGNKKHNRYYPVNVVERDIGVFEGVDVFATDHKEKERSERTKVGRVLSCPTRFTESKAPVAQVLIYDPAQAEKTRNRNDAGQLETMECSIFGKGTATPGTVDGKEYSVVESMTKGSFLELVSKAGAGGKALSLAENIDGGETMKGQEEKTTPAPDEDVTEVDIQEGEGEAEQETEEITPSMLESEAVETALAETNLPEFVKASLCNAQYTDATDLKESISNAVAEIKKLTGSGQVQDLGESEPPKGETLTVEELEQLRVDNFNAVMREVGLKEV
jgi:hypothetical protein